MIKDHNNIPYPISIFIRNHLCIMIAIVTIADIIVLYLPKHSYQFMILDSHEMLARSYHVFIFSDQFRWNAVYR